MQGMTKDTGTFLDDIETTGDGSDLRHIGVSVMARSLMRFISGMKSVTVMSISPHLAS